MPSSPDRQSQPLLSADEENAPVLGGSSAVEESPLERLILESSLAQAPGAPASFFLEDPESSPYPASEGVPRGPSAAEIYRTSITTLIAGTFCLLHICLVWSSFFSTVWFETHLTVTVGPGKPSKFTRDQILQSTTLRSLLSSLLSGGQEWPATLLVLTCLISPCLVMIVCSSWTYGDYEAASNPPKPRTISQVDLLGFDPRIFAEQVLIRVGFLVFFLLVIFDLGTSPIVIENNNSEFLVTNRPVGGLICYVLGTSCALVVVVILRFASKKPFRTAVNHGQQRSTDREGLVPVGPSEHSLSELRRPLLAIEDTEESVRVPIGGSAGEQRLAPWKRFMAYEFGVLSIVLWIPAASLPLFSLKLDGLVAAFIDERLYKISFYQIPLTLLLRAHSGDTATWILLALGGVFMLLVYMLPLVATYIAVVVWRSPIHSKIVWFYKEILRYIQPSLCGCIFSVAVMCAMPAFDSVVGGTLDNETSGFCQKFLDVTGTMCLSVQGQSQIGLWFLLAQGVCLEIFVWMTLLWKQ